MFQVLRKVELFRTNCIFAEMKSETIGNDEINYKLSRTIKLPILFIFAILFEMAVINASAFDTNLDTTLPSDCTLKLHYGKEIPLTQPAAQILYSNTLIMLKSSNFNSSKYSTREWTEWGTDTETEIHTIQEDYRLAIALDEYLVVSFNKPLKIETVGGIVIASEIVASLSKHQIALYTIDDEGRLISHAMFSGPRSQKLVNWAESIVKDADK